MLGLELGVVLQLQVGDLLAGAALLVGLALLDLRGDALALGGHDLAESGRRFLAGSGAGRDHHLARNGEGDRLGRGSLAEAGQELLDLLRGLDDLLGAGGPLLLELALGGGKLGVELVLLAMEARLELVLEIAQGAAALASPTLGLVLERSQGSAASFLVHVGDDVQGEVENPLQVAGADVQQDAKAARRALEIPDVADRAGKLDVAHALATNLGASDLHAALVADDALVPNPLVLAAVALPILGGTEDALVEETVLLRLERAVVDRLGLGDLTRGPIPDLLWTGERNPDRVEVVDFEHSSPPRRRLARWRSSNRGPAMPGWPGTGAASCVQLDQSSNPARLMPPRSGIG